MSLVDDHARPGPLGGELRIATGRLQRALRRQRGTVALSEGQFSALSALVKHKAMSPGALAEHEHVSAPSMTRIVNTLVLQGFAVKHEHESDRRQVVVEPTAAGREEIGETRRRRDAWLTQRLELLTPDERDHLARTCTILSKLTEK